MLKFLTLDEYQRLALSNDNKIAIVDTVYWLSIRPYMVGPAAQASWLSCVILCVFLTEGQSVYCMFLVKTYLPSGMKAIAVFADFDAASNCLTSVYKKISYFIFKL